MTVKTGLRSGVACQHNFMMSQLQQKKNRHVKKGTYRFDLKIIKGVTHMAAGQLLGGLRRAPVDTISITSWLPQPGYGMQPMEKTSHRRMPNAHTSVLELKSPSTKASGGIHFTGSIALPPLR